jgi:tRNA(Ile)-lysidine synthase
MDDWLFLLKTVRLSWGRLGKPRRVTAAVSGGADSVALLHALHALSKEEELSLSVAHVDHCLRPGSKADASFVVNVCRELGIPCRVFEVQVDGSSEDAARNARYEALREACRENGTSVLALAHHLRDQAETLLLHLFRGSGGGGLSAMTEFSQRTWPEGESITLWRPWLSVSPETIRAALKEMCVSWREDETNAGDAYLRNYIRHQVLPAVAARIPHAEEAVGRAAKILSEEEAYFRHEAKLFLERENNACLYDPCRWIRYIPLARLHPVLRRHALRLACPVTLDFETTERLSALSPGEIMNLPEGWRAQCSKEYLHFLPPVGREIPPALPMPGTLIVQPWNGETGDGIRTQAMKKSVYDQCRLRDWEPGDRIHPLGAKGSKSMQDYFVDKKLPRPFRRYVPLLCIGSQVVWAIGTGASEEARVSPGDDAVLLTYEGFLPGAASCPPVQNNDG